MTATTATTPPPPQAPTPAGEPPWAPGRLRAAMTHWMRHFANDPQVNDSPDVSTESVEIADRVLDRVAREFGMDVEAERARRHAAWASAPPALPPPPMTEAAVLDHLDHLVAVELGDTPAEPEQFATALRVFDAVEQVRVELALPRYAIVRPAPTESLATVLAAEAVFDGVRNATLVAPAPAWSIDLLLRVHAGTGRWRPPALGVGSPSSAATRARERLSCLGMSEWLEGRQRALEVAVATEWRVLEVESVVRIRRREADGGGGEDEFPMLAEVVAHLHQMGTTRAELMQIARAATAS